MFTRAGGICKRRIGPGQKRECDLGLGLGVIDLPGVNAGPLTVEGIAGGLTLRRVGTRSGQRLIEVLPEVVSTNDLAWARAGGAASDGYMVFAEHQSAGRGRFGRRWESPRGAAVMCSLLLYEQNGPPSPLCSLAAGIACVDAVRETTGVAVQLEWPNDLVIHGRKVGGILVESRVTGGPLVNNGHASHAQPCWYVIGMGINCLQQRGHFPEALRGRATSLEMESAIPIDRSALARAMLRRLDEWFSGNDWRNGPLVRERWLQVAAPLGSWIRLSHDGREYRGHVVDVDPTASLVLQLEEGGRLHFEASRTTVLRENGPP